MKDGFIKTAASDIGVKVADIKHNLAQIKSAISKADELGANILVLPELCITGYSCGDLFYSENLISSALKALKSVAEFTKGKYPVVVVGFPFMYRCKLYNCAAVVCDGKILGIVPKTNLPNYGEFYEKRQFSAPSPEFKGMYADIFGENIPFGTDIIFSHSSLSNYTFGIEICEDLWAPCPPSEKLCENGAVLILNPSASDETIGKDDYRRLLVSSASARLICGYVYANAQYTESTQDTVFSSHHIIGENGCLLAENKPFENQGMIISEIDINRLASERHKNTSFVSDKCGGFRYINFEQKVRETLITRRFEKNPFVPQDEKSVSSRAESILKMQSYGLARRIEHTNAKKCVIGISGGLDSTLAVLVSVRAMDILKRPRTDILAVTMPCFGTTHRTKSNSVKLCESLGVTLKEINITKAVTQHFADIEQDLNNYDVTFENAQARERTQVLMDLANKHSGFVVGTGDLSELALGWATYNGDHISMYGVNSSVPKTLVRCVVAYEMSRADECLAEILADILDTPVSPELLPVDENGNMSQKTEDLVGPYELHDFYLYYTVRFGFAPRKIYRLAKYAFGGIYSDETVKHWLKVFIRRFFSQQFKRSCMPDGPKIGSVTLSPRGDWRMPSDASSALWLEEAENL